MDHKKECKRMGKKLKLAAALQRSETTKKPSVLTLADEHINEVLSFSFPVRDGQKWEWTGILRQTCKNFQEVSRHLAPTELTLNDFTRYQPIKGNPLYVDGMDGIDSSIFMSGLFPPPKVIDARVEVLQSLMKHLWKAECLTKLCVNWSSVLAFKDDGRIEGKTGDEKVLKTLRSLLMTPNSLPNLTCLDINLQSDHLYEYDLVDSTFLTSMPSALPSLKHLCLSYCSKDSSDEVSPNDLKMFFESLQSPLESLSITDVHWMTDDHVAAFLPVIGSHLTRLELIECRFYEYEYDEENGEIENTENLTDASAEVIAKECNKLTSFAFVGTKLTAAGLEKVLSANPNISTLNLSSNSDIGSNHGHDAVNVISRYLPRLKVLRHYWSQSEWLNDDTLISLIDAQKSHSNGASIYLERLGLSSSRRDTLTKKGLDYALKHGLKAVEVEPSSILFKSSDAGEAEFFHPTYIHFVDGSSENYCCCCEQ